MDSLGNAAIILSSAEEGIEKGKEVWKISPCIIWPYVSPENTKKSERLIIGGKELGYRKDGKVVPTKSQDDTVICHYMGNIYHLKKNNELFNITHTILPITTDMKPNPSDPSDGKSFTEQQQNYEKNITDFINIYSSKEKGIADIKNLIT
jgi:hypothetical protein